MPKPLSCLLLTTLLMLACRKVEPAPAAPPTPKYALAELRRTFHTKLAPSGAKPESTTAPTPPPGFFDKVTYPAPLGQNVAYVSPVRPGERRPAIVWIGGGFTWDVGESAWEPAPRANDQSARAFREAGIALMLPALRGANGNPGSYEAFLGEVDDVLAAADFVATRPDVDPNRIYIGGHSTGGTMALLAVASTGRFRAAFAFGPVASPVSYGQDKLPFDVNDQRELVLRSPVAFMQDVTTPTFVIEGGRGNIRSMGPLHAAAKGGPVRLVLLHGHDHFSGLAPMSELLAKKILADTGAATNIEISDPEVAMIERDAPNP